MSVLVDTGVLYADHDAGASRHEAAVAAVEAVYDGELGQPYVSDYIYDEAITLTLKRAGAFSPAQTLGEKLRAAGPYPEIYEFQRIKPSVFDEAVEVFERYDDQRLSFTDASTIALARREDVDTILSFDDDFDGLYDRTPPESL